MQKTVIDALIERNEMIKKLKLTSTINTTNMHVFDADCKIRRVDSPEEIIYRFYNVRKQHYIKRRDYLIKTLNSDLELLDSKIKFIKLVIREEIIVFNKKKDFIIKQISEHNLLKVNDSYDYLMDLKLWTLTAEKIEDLEKESVKMKTELEILKTTTVSKMWKSELFSLNY
jgi:DNA topoisomerase-2